VRSFNLHSTLLTIVVIAACNSDNQKMPDNFIALNDLNSNIKIDLRYYSTDNFTGDTITGYNANRLLLTKPTAEALISAQDELEQKGLGLKIFDAYRPQRAVDHFVEWAEDLPDTTMKSKYYPDVPKSELFEKGYIAGKSGHSRGSTVDLTIVYLNGSQAGEEMDMGTYWDFFSPLSWPMSDSVSLDQKLNRMLLRELMIRNGFKPLKEEWWHFTLSDEPYPDTYFDFVVK